MDSKAIRLVASFLLRIDPRDRVRYWTIIRLLCTESEISEWTNTDIVRASDKTLDPDVVWEIVSAASTEELSHFLARIAPNGLGIDHYLHCFNRLFDEDLSDATLLRVAYAADRFLDKHPGAFRFPPGLLKRLLASADADTHLRGILLLRHSEVPPATRLSIILNGIERVRTDYPGFDLICMTAFRELVWEYDLTHFDDLSISRTREVLLASLARHRPDDQRIVHQCLAYLPPSGE